MANYGATEQIPLARAEPRPHLLHAVIGFCAVLSVAAAGWGLSHGETVHRVVEVGYPYRVDFGMPTHGMQFQNGLSRLSEDAVVKSQSPFVPKNGDKQWEDFKDYKVQSALKGLLYAEDKQKSLMSHLKIEDQLNPADVGEAFAGSPQ